MTDEAAEPQTHDGGSQTVADGGGSPDVPTEQVVEVGGPLSEEHAVEFPSAWHRDAYVAGLQRELDGAHVREDKEGAANVERELARLGGGSKAKQTRPRGAGKQTR